MVVATSDEADAKFLHVVVFLHTNFVFDLLFMTDFPYKVIVPTFDESAFLNPTFVK